MRLQLFALSLLVPTLACLSEDPQSGPTGVRGRVRETVSQDPLPGVLVSVGDDQVGWTEATTDAEGWFEVADFDPASTRMRLDGRTASTAEAHYPVVTTQLHEAWVMPGRTILIPQDKYLPRIDDSTAVDLSSVLLPSPDPDHPAADGWQQIDPAAAPVRVAAEDVVVPGARGPDGEPLRSSVYTVLAPGSFIKLPEDAAPVLTVTQVPVDQLPHQLPEYVSPLMMVTFQPGGTRVDPPAELHFGDLRGFGASAPQMTFSIWSLSHQLALFLDLGEAGLADGVLGPEIASAEGVGLSELGWHGPVCTTVAFQADLRIYEDGIYHAPAPGAVSMRVIGGGVTGGFDRTFASGGDRVMTGNLSSCGGYFSFTFQPVMASPDSSWAPVTYDVPAWRCARNPGTNAIGTLTIDLSSGTPRLSAAFGLDAC